MQPRDGYHLATFRPVIEPPTTAATDDFVAVIRSESLDSLQSPVDEAAKRPLDRPLAERVHVVDELL